MKSIHVDINYNQISHLRVWPSRHNPQHVLLIVHRDSGYTGRILLDLRQAIALQSALATVVQHQLSTQLASLQVK